MYMGHQLYPFDAQGDKIYYYIYVLEQLFVAGVTYFLSLRSCNSGGDNFFIGLLAIGLGSKG